MKQCLRKLLSNTKKYQSVADISERFSIFNHFSFISVSFFSHIIQVIVHMWACFWGSRSWLTSLSLRQRTLQSAPVEFHVKKGSLSSSKFFSFFSGLWAFQNTIMVDKIWRCIFVFLTYLAVCVLTEEIKKENVDEPEAEPLFSTLDIIVLGGAGKILTFYDKIWCDEL